MALIVGTTTVSHAQGTNLLYTTMDSLAAITSPSVGTGAGASTVNSGYVAGHNGNAVQINAANQYVRFQETNGTTNNINIGAGTIDFWMYPTWNSGDGVAHRFFQDKSNGAASSVYFSKKTNNYLEFGETNSSGVTSSGADVDVSASGAQFPANTWVELRATWDMNAASGVQNTRIYVNGVESTYVGSPVTGPISFSGTLSTSQYLYIGALSATDSTTQVCQCLIDDFYIYGAAGAPPTSTPTTGPTSTPTNTPTTVPTSTSAPTSTPAPTIAAGCANPGNSYNSANGTQYEFLTAANLYASCLLGIADATREAVPTATPVPTSTPTLTPIPTNTPASTSTPTLSATQQAVFTQTGCNANGNDPNSYQDCIIHDAEVRSNSYVFWTIPLILVAVIAFGVTSRGRFGAEH